MNPNKSANRFTTEPIRASNIPEKKLPITANILPPALNVDIALVIPENSPTNACITRPTGPKNLIKFLVLKLKVGARIEAYSILF